MSTGSSAQSVTADFHAICVALKENRIDVNTFDTTVDCRNGFLDSQAGALGDALRANTHLRKLSLAVAALFPSGQGLAALVRGIRENKSLEKIELGCFSCSLERTVGVIDYFLEAIAGHPSIESLTLISTPYKASTLGNVLKAGNLRELSLLNISLAPADHNHQELVKALRTSQSIQKLHLADKPPLSNMTPILDMLSSNSSVTELRIDGNLSHDSAKALQAYLRSGTSALSILRIHGVRLIPDSLDLVVTGILEQSSLSRLKEFQLEDCTFYPGASTALHRLADSSVETLGIPGCRLGNSFVEAFLPQLYNESGSTSQIARLDLSKNGLTGRAAGETIRKFLRKSNRLLHLNLSRNSLDQFGCRRVLDSLRSSNKTLISLDLSECRPGETTVATTLVSVLRSHPSLEHLSLSYNVIGEGAIALAQTLVYDDVVLKTLKLVSCRLTDSEMMAIVHALQINRSLTSLAMHDNILNESTLQCIARSLPNIQGLEHLDLSWPESVSVSSSLWIDFERGLASNTNSLRWLTWTGRSPEAQGLSDRLQFYVWRNRCHPLLVSEERGLRSALLFPRLFESALETANTSIVYHLLHSGQFDG